MGNNLDRTNDRHKGESRAAATSSPMKLAPSTTARRAVAARLKGDDGVEGDAAQAVEVVEASFHKRLSR